MAADVEEAAESESDKDEAEDEAVEENARRLWPAAAEAERVAAADGSEERAAKGAMVFACAAVEAVTVREQGEVEEKSA